jgi:hypothetical protein
MIQQFCIKQSLEFSFFCDGSKCFIVTVFCLFVTNMGGKLVEQEAHTFQ